MDGWMIDRSIKRERIDRWIVPHALTLGVRRGRELIKVKQRVLTVILPTSNWRDLSNNLEKNKSFSTLPFQ